LSEERDHVDGRLLQQVTVLNCLNAQMGGCFYDPAPRLLGVGVAQNPAQAADVSVSLALGAVLLTLHCNSTDRSRRVGNGVYHSCGRLDGAVAQFSRLFMLAFR